MNRYLSTLRSNLYKLRPLHCRVRNSQILGEVIIGTKAIVTDSVLCSGVNIEERVRVVSATISGRVNVGRYTTIYGPNVGVFAGLNPINIGGFCSIARGVAIQEYNHIASRPTTYFISQNVFKEHMRCDIESKGGITIGHDVWIGANAVILSGASIGNGAIVSAGAVVTKDVPDFAIVAGVPAKVIGFRFSEEAIQQLMDLKWWFWSIEKIKEHKAFFQKNFE